MSLTSEHTPESELLHHNANAFPCGLLILTKECQTENHYLCNDDTGLICKEHGLPIVCKCKCHNYQGAR